MFFNARSSILITGSPTDEFSLFSGLRHEDSLAPFFIIAIKGLHVAMEDMVYVGVFSGDPFSSGEISISHFFYTDDALFLG